MGSKTSEDDRRDHNDAPYSKKIPQAGGLPRGAHIARNGDSAFASGGGDDDSDDDAALRPLAQLNPDVPSNETELCKKRRKQTKKKKKKKKKRSAAVHGQQTSPPRIPLSDLFPTADYPEGEIQSYTRAPAAVAEMHYNGVQEAQDSEFFCNYRKAAEVHRQARKWVHDTVRPGQDLLSIAEGIEDSIRSLLGNSGLGLGDGLRSGMGFPTGLCLNHQTAHYTPNPGQKAVVLQEQDVMKVDFGVHINGWIVDSAFTMAFDPTYDNLLAAVKEATNEGVKATGIDVRICDVSAAIHETMESYEVEIRGKTFPVKPVKNICAHNIKHYQIHGGKSIPFIRNSDQTKMEAGEVFAIETFGSTGRAYLRDDIGVYGYGLQSNAPLAGQLPLASAKRLHKTIRENFGTIVFCRRYLDRLGQEKYLAGMNCLVSNGIVESYAPLRDIEGSYSAQFEHTIVLRETHKEVLSRGDDY
ncbi:Methionine aminopeptidase 2 [Verticillium nonalfalfae]|uniref:Methionine aminopeptidase 2 n=1 Tax=Verticillium nonalfalfae TaxID=1051616 RepID=A0A3M9YJG3_9PEZI|nr:Methionine aminopeptidase 2 [Verticillium nonalfalfae]RNJ60221.1 Methionine aminopeptidase 2 [Verticillium nonalfalfae]